MCPIAIAVVAFLLVAADNPQDLIEKEMAQLEGEWSMVSGEINGQAMPEEYRKTASRVAKAGETTIMIAGQLFMKAKYTIDPAKKPKTIDYDVIEGPTKGKKQLGLYELGEGTVRFCFASPGQERPTDFSAKEGSGRTLSAWKRNTK